MKFAQSLIVASLLAQLVTGCASSQIAKVQAEKEQLKAHLAEDKKTIDDLASQLADATQRAAEAERDLALTASGRAPTKRVDDVSANLMRSPSIVSADWTKNDALLKYDPLRKAAQAKLELQFSENDQLTIASRRQLDRIADLLSTQSSSHLAARVKMDQSSLGEARAAARASAVKDYLRTRGIDATRLESVAATSENIVGGLGVEVYERIGAVASDPTPADGWKTSEKRR